MLWTTEKTLLPMKRTKELQHGACTICLPSAVRFRLTYIYKRDIRLPLFTLRSFHFVS